MTENTARKQRTRGGGRPFEPGQSGNPKGKPPGTRHAATMLAERLLTADVERVVQAVLDAAAAGDMAASRIVMDRLAPVRKGAAIRFDIPPITTAEDVDHALIAIVRLMAGGELSPEEAATAAGVVELRRKSIESREVERRLVEIEARLAGKGEPT